MDASSSMLSPEQVASRLFPGADLRGSVDEFMAVARLMADEPVYVTSSAETQGELLSVEAAYVQGQDGFLKVQRLAVESDARQIRARAVGNSATVVQNATWVFLHDERGWRELQPSRGFCAPRWQFETSGGELVVVACYPFARSCVKGSELVWIESEEWARRVRQLDVYGSCSPNFPGSMWRTWGRST